MYVNASVTGNKDVMLATSIYGPLAETVAGKSKSHGPAADASVYVPVDLRREQTMYADIFCWHGEPYLLFVVKPLHLLITRHLMDKDMVLCKGVYNI
jgi:hypothetical protein